MKVLAAYIVTGVLLTRTQSIVLPALRDAVGEPEHAGDEGHHEKGDLCPDEETIAPCVCSYIVEGDGKMDLDCSKVTGEEQLNQVFENIPPVMHFETFTLNSNHKLKVLKSDVFHTITFTKIMMIYNSLEQVESGAFDGCTETLTTIDMWGNRISSQTGFPFIDLPKFTSLTVLDLADNAIPGWPEGIQSDTLIRLDLSGNPVTLLPQGAFDGLSILEDLVLGNVNLTVIDPGTFENLDKLKSLDLRQNEFTNLTEGSLSFTSPNILHIYVHHNKLLKSIHPHAISSPNNVPDLHFNANQFISVVEAVWRPWLANGSRLNFNGNPLVCDCGIGWLIQNRDLLDQIEAPVYCGGQPDNDWPWMAEANCKWQHYQPTTLHCLDPADYENC